MALGIIFKIIEPKRAYRIEEHVQAFGEFSDTVSAPDFKPKQRAVALISFDGETLAYAALATRGQRVATQKHVIRFTRLIDLDGVDVDELLPLMGTARGRTVARFLEEEGGTLSPETWAELRKALKQVRPDAVSELDALGLLAETRPRVYRGQGYETVAEEKDAFLLATEIFGIKRRLSARLLSPPRELAPFLVGLPDATRIEDVMIQKDKTTLADWIATPEDQVGSVMLQRRDGRKLTIINVNRTRIEETLGVDLIYYNHTFRSFVMVQYKVMESEEDENGDNIAIYRPNDSSYKKELARMESHVASRPPMAPNTREAFRLSSNGFLFKLCPRITFDPLSTAPIKGMYLPLDYWRLLVASPQVRGPKGGVQITYANSGRYFDNGLFVRLVEDGWIGSPIDKERELSDLIRTGLGAKRSVIYAKTSRN